MSAGDITPGRRRRFDPTTGEFDERGNPLDRAPGDYWRDLLNDWHCCTPGPALLGNLTRHEVTEHEDGTITVQPSILVRGGHAGEWHGYLERGIWREV